ncbi:uncharacterized protein LOC143019165 [Oratosquilla oratoria]|uniref:uncharacterized protein LOC143019165 n=1 Tax=Oratosquilla oratoria TaxID=337810 RepID=UPI003F76CE7B
MKNYKDNAENMKRRYESRKRIRVLEFDIGDTVTVEIPKLDRGSSNPRRMPAIINSVPGDTDKRFREMVYHQRIGTPMGSPISVVLAEMAMQEFEEEMLAAAPVALKTWMRYVDDVLLDYESCHPVEHKKSVVKTLWSRAGYLCSTEENLKEERKHLEKVFADNGYPKSVIRRWTTAQGRKTTADARQAATRRITLPYVKGASEVAARLLRKRGVEIDHKPANTLHGALIKVKDTEEKESKTGVVYDIGCGNYGTRYIGETGFVSTASTPS